MCKGVMNNPRVLGAGAGGTPPPLKKYVGNIDTRGQARSDLATYWDQITPENAGKWGSVEATRDVMNWQALDDAYNFAKTNHLPFKFHNLIWGQQQPGWLAALPADQQLAEIDQYAVDAGINIWQRSSDD